MEFATFVSGGASLVGKAAGGGAAALLPMGGVISTGAMLPAGRVVAMVDGKREFCVGLPAGAAVRGRVVAAVAAPRGFTGVAKRSCLTVFCVGGEDAAESDEATPASGSDEAILLLKVVKEMASKTDKMLDEINAWSTTLSSADMITLKGLQQRVHSVLHAIDSSSVSGEDAVLALVAVQSYIRFVVNPGEKDALPVIIPPGVNMEVDAVKFGPDRLNLLEWEEKTGVARAVYFTFLTEMAVADHLNKGRAPTSESAKVVTLDLVWKLARKTDTMLDEIEASGTLSPAVMSIVSSFQRCMHDLLLAIDDDSVCGEDAVLTLVAVQSYIRFVVDPEEKDALPLIVPSTEIDGAMFGPYRLNVHEWDDKTRVARAVYSTYVTEMAVAAYLNKN